MIRIIRAVLLTSLPLSMLAGETLCQGTRRYTYDAQGNRTMVTNLVRLTSSAAFSIQPRRAVSGDRVNVFGRNFPAGDTNAVSVSFDSIPATVLSVSDRVITVDDLRRAIGLDDSVGEVVVLVPEQSGWRRSVTLRYVA